MYIQNVKIEVVQVKNGSKISVATITNDLIIIHYAIEVSDKLPLQFAGASSEYTIIFSIAMAADFVSMLICYVKSPKSNRLASC